MCVLDRHSGTKIPVGGRESGPHIRCTCPSLTTSCSAAIAANENSATPTDQGTLSHTHTYTYTCTYMYTLNRILHCRQPNKVRRQLSAIYCHISLHHRAEGQGNEIYSLGYHTCNHRCHILFTFANHRQLVLLYYKTVPAKHAQTHAHTHIPCW